VVSFNATTRDSIVFNNVTYKNQSTEHPFHDLAVTMLNGKMDFPVMVFADEKGMLISPVPGYFTPRNIEPLLHFFRDQAYLTQRWDEYVEKFKSSFPK
jgi:thioredoxin-related protein